MVTVYMVLICVRAVLICSRAARKNNTSGAKFGTRADNGPGPRTEDNAMYKDISEENQIKWPNPSKYSQYAFMNTRTHINSYIYVKL